MESAAPDAEPLRHKQSAQVRATDGLLVATDELGDFESSQQTIRQIPPVPGASTSGAEKLEIASR